MVTETGKALRVVVFLDGRPGHEKQTMGIIRALQLRGRVNCIQIKLTKATLLDKLVQSVLLFLPSFGTGKIETLLGLDDGTDKQIGQADLLLGAGSTTHLPLLLYKKKFAIPACTCMTPPHHLLSRFDLCFVPEHDGLVEQDHIMHTLGAPNCSENKKMHRHDCGLILIGGIDVKSHYWDSVQVAGMIDQLVLREEEKSWTISSSPRTPLETVELVKELQTRYKNITFFDYKDTPPGWVEEQYDCNEEVWVTADSISMVYEALTAGCRVGIFPMRWLKEKSKFKRNEDVLLDKNLVISFPSWQKGESAQWQKIEIDEAGRCADRILEKFKF